MKVIFICDMTELSGLGHFNRMKILYEEFQRNEVKCTFIFPALHKSFIEKHALKFDREYIFSLKGLTHIHLVSLNLLRIQYSKVL